MRRLLIAIVVTLVSPTALAAPDPTAPGWDVARIVVIRRDPADAQKLLAQLDGADVVVARKAAKVVRVIGVSEVEAFRMLLAHPALTERGLRLVMTDLESMPAASAKRQSLTAIAEAVLRIVAAKR